MDSESGTPIPVIYERLDSTKPDKSHLLELIDGIEKQVESLRMQVAYLEEEKDGISTALDSLRQCTFIENLMEDEREEISFSLERLGVRVSSIEVTVKTQRDSMQIEALGEVNDFINRVVAEIDRDALVAKAQCNSFLNTCVSEPEAGPVDKAFESALLGCTLDDQKRIRKRLLGLMNYLDRLTISSV